VFEPKSLKKKLLSLLPYLNEKQQRIVAVVEARSLGYGGVSEVAEATGLSRTTIHRAIEELEDPAIRSHLKADRVRCRGGGEKGSLFNIHPF